MTSFFYKWLPILFGCHCRSDRSFYFNKKQFPICARCTGELIGMFISIPLIFFNKPSIIILIILMIPMIIDGFLQLLTSYESKNYRRLISGIFFGYSFFTLFLMSNIFVFNIGYSFASNFKNL